MLVAKAKITSKDQITVPREVRRKLGVGPGDRLLFEEDKGGFRVKPDRNESVFEQFRGVGNPGIPPGCKGIIRWTRQMRGK
jgi:antitoxin PrlF